jgi:hypothetical protein
MDRPGQTAVCMTDPRGGRSTLEPTRHDGEFVDEVTGDRCGDRWGLRGVGAAVAEAHATVINADHAAIGFDL